MSSIPISLLDIEDDASQCLVAEDYQTREGKWCAGCGDFGALNAVKRLLAKEQLQTPFDRSATAVQAWVKRKLEKLQVEPRWTPHDLRRTAVTRMNEVGIDPFVAERTIGHTLPTKMMAVYNRAVFEAERANAMERLTAHIEEVIHGKQ